jgi:hypothetical protein
VSDITGTLDAMARSDEFTLSGFLREFAPIPENAMRVAPGSDAVVWKISPDHCGEL